MCGRAGFVAPKDESEVWERYALSNKPKLKTTYNIAPSMEALAVRHQSPNFGEYMKFGVEAAWKPGLIIINAKAETIVEKKMFKPLLESYRCLIPVSFYFEWKKIGKAKQPYLFKVKNGDYFSLAGIYKPGSGFIIITCEPNSLQSRIHDRMPVILPKSDENEWLNEDKTTDELLEMLQPYPSKDMETYPVNSLVNSPSHQGVEVIEPLLQ